MPVTKPVNKPTVAAAVLLLLQLPPGVVQAKVVDAPALTVAAPVIAAGDITVTNAVATAVPQPLVTV